MNKDSISLRSFHEHGDQSQVMLFIAESRYLDSAKIADNEKVFGALAERFRIYLLASPLPERTEVREFVHCLRACLQDAGIRWTTVVGFGHGASVAQALVIESPKLVRRLILLDATTRLLPSLFTRLLDRIEQSLPLGLPLRRLSRSFDSRPELHRIHCPTLILCSRVASAFVLEQAKFISQRIPNSWLHHCECTEISGTTGLASELVGLLMEFQDIPAKCPQKQARAAS